MDPGLIATILGGAGTAGWTTKEIVRLTRENKTLKAERDQYYNAWIEERNAHSETKAQIAALSGQVTALTEQVGRQTDEIKRQADEIHEQAKEIAALKQQVVRRPR